MSRENLEGRIDALNKRIKELRDEGERLWHMRMALVSERDELCDKLEATMGQDAHEQVAP